MATFFCSIKEKKLWSESFPRVIFISSLPTSSGNTSVLRGGEQGRAELLVPHASAFKVVIYG